MQILTSFEEMISSWKEIYCCCQILEVVGEFLCVYTGNLSAKIYRIYEIHKNI